MRACGRRASMFHASAWKPYCRPTLSASSFSFRRGAEMPRYARPVAPAFDAIEIEGVLIAPAMLAKIAACQADGQTDASYCIPKGLTLRDEIARYFRIGQAQFRDFAKLDSPSTTATKAFV